MIISKSTVDLAAQHASTSHTEVTESLRAWVGDARPDFEAMEKGTTASISAAALAALKANPPVAAPEVGAAGETQALLDALEQADNDPIIHLIRLMVEMLTGHKIGSMSVQAAPASAAAATPSPSGTPAAPAQGAPAAPTRAGYGIEYDRHELHSETEQTRVQASGTVVTSDGRQIGFKLALSMQRSYSEESSTSLRAGDGVKKDPLVINFDSASVGLEGQRFSFNLDSRGQTDMLPMLAKGSGFLALDLNHNGVIDSGKELFGASSGQGFADLGRYDSDGNAWIDENDPIFKQLRIWTPGTEGGGSLSTLADKNVGALGLAQTATPFELRDSANRSLGSVRATGVFLREDGSAGSLQQVDLTV